jgi:hypothetical protein
MVLNFLSHVSQPSLTDSRSYGFGKRSVIQTTIKPSQERSES